jgi:hypothetical protein
MAFDPCGTRRLDGDDIIKRLATYLGVEIVDLTEALKHISNTNKAFRSPDEDKRR